MRRPRPASIRLGLARVARALARLGHPQDDFASVLVAGTNGKGSVSAFIESVLRAAGYRTGLYTSPHLVSVTERVRVAGRPVGNARWAALLRRARRAARQARVVLTEFELHTAAAFLHFRDERLDIAVVEVGLGGRLDATNTLPAPEATLIASIGHDHLDWLGPSLRHVLFEKSGILRPTSPHVESVPAGLAAAARRRRYRALCVWTAGEEMRLTARRTDWTRGRQTFDARLPGVVHRGLEIGMTGLHQVDNAGLAVAVCELMRRRGWHLPETALREGLRAARWPGRFQVLRGDGRTRPDVILDGAHNVEAAAALSAAYAASPWGDRTATLVFGCLRDKDAEGIVETLAPRVHRVLVLPLPTPRSRPAEELRGLWSRLVPARVVPDFRSAWTDARRDVASPVLVTGSLYLVGEALKTFGTPF